MKKIPISAAKEVAKKYDATVTCIIAWDGKTGVTHVTTYGENKQECEWAADLGNQIKRKVLKWPEDQCNAKPKRTQPKAEVPSNPYSEYKCERCGETRNGYENHHCVTIPCNLYGCRGRKYANEVACEACSNEPADDLK